MWNWIHCMQYLKQLYHTVWDTSLTLYNLHHFSCHWHWHCLANKGIKWPNFLKAKASSTIVDLRQYSKDTLRFQTLIMLLYKKVRAITYLFYSHLQPLVPPPTSLSVCGRLLFQRSWRHRLCSALFKISFINDQQN